MSGLWSTSTADASTRSGSILLTMTRRRTGCSRRDYGSFRYRPEAMPEAAVAQRPRRHQVQPHAPHSLPYTPHAPDLLRGRDHGRVQHRERKRSSASKFHRLRVARERARDELIPPPRVRTCASVHSRWFGLLPCNNLGYIHLGLLTALRTVTLACIRRFSCWQHQQIATPADSKHPRVKHYTEHNLYLWHCVAAAVTPVVDQERMYRANNSQI